MRTPWLLLSFLCVAGFIPSSISGEEADNKYRGAEKCLTCHSAPAKGAPYDVWLKSKHAKAFETLGTEEAKKLGKAKGIDDPQTNAACLSCHVTAYEAPAEQKHKKFDPKQGVQCETCHGPGDKHVKARLAGQDPPADKPLALPEGEIVRAPGMATCKKCHNENSPSYKPFCYKEFAKQIAHLDPRRNHPADYFEKLPCDCEKCKK